MIRIYERPAGSRGFAPLIMAALASGIGRATIGAVEGNQTKQRNKGYINASYRLASQNLNTQQAYSREDLAESANARGLAQGSDVSASPIRTAMLGDKMVAGTTTMAPGQVKLPFGTVTKDLPSVQRSMPTTVGGQQMSDAGVQMGLERKDLDQKHDQALRENNTEYTNALLGAAASGAQTAESVYGMGSDVAAGQAATAAASASRSRIHAAILSGGSYDGIHVNDPLGEPTSSWSTRPRLAGPDDTSASFNVG